MSANDSDVDQTGEEFQQQLRARVVANHTGANRTSRINKRQFVLLRERDRRFQSVPRRGRAADLLNSGRVQEIYFTQNDSSEAILALLTANFPMLRMENNLIARLEFYKSINRGTSMEMVFEGEVPSGYNIKNAFRSGRVLIHLKPNVDVSNTTPSTSNGTTAAVTTGQTNTQTSNTHSSQQTSSQTTYTTRTTSENVTTPSTSGLGFHRIDSVDLTEELIMGEFHPPNISTPVSVPSDSDSNDENEDDDDDGNNEGIAIEGPAFFGDGIKVGVLEECETEWEKDDIEHILWHSEEVGGNVIPLTGSIEQVGLQALISERSVVFLMIKKQTPRSLPPNVTNFLRLVGDLDGNEVPLLRIVSRDTMEGREVGSKYNLTMQEETFASFVLCVPTIPDRLLPVEFVSDLKSVEEAIAAIQNCHALVEQYRMYKKKQRQRECLKADQDQQRQVSSNVDKSKDKTASTASQTDPLPQLAETDETINKERKQKENEEKKIRTTRAARVNEPPATGNEIKIITPIGTIQRTFADDAKYQEVYDWLGSNVSLPLYFVIRNLEGAVMNTHDTIETMGSVLRMEQYTQEELEEHFGHESVFFNGTIPPSGQDERSTIISEGEMEAVKQQLQREKKGEGE